MKKLLLILCLVISGCASTSFKDTKVVTETHYVVRTATAQQKELPPYPANLDINTATQTDLANWIAENEDRQLKLELIIKELINFYESPVVGEK